MGKGNKVRGREKKKPKQDKKPAASTAVAPRAFIPAQPAPVAQAPKPVAQAVKPVASSTPMK
jgi:hypothetical protein